MREMKLRAVREGRKLRDVAAEIFRHGMAASAPARAPTRRPRLKLPLIRCGTDAPAAKMTAEELIALEQQVLLEEDLRRAGQPL